MVIEDVWVSVVKVCQGIIEDVRDLYPDVQVNFIDWEAHANIAELPNSDLIGPTALAFTEQSPGLSDATFAIAASTYADDTNLFRQRKIMSLIFERMRPMKQMKVYDAGSALEKGFMIFTDGTTLVPMTRSEARPWQYVQGQALLGEE
ncbi:MAG: hypothetical protein EOQ39_18775 [Mesorhizobium sp.]|uniref:hypothetical protein n=1 Tax=Mesorhizobium sp. TaxID=1871066 RepID=UPI000FE516E6|nr:hypothetical protein [Mesorhizobium sp.]RWB08784.1 MAG: hypothetical protein EOQ37_04565 [Mesorhizobium sp.]RWB13565.1 MAG: hypothetical protein EOQ39_18775 [Mesorhizobium sp.]